MQLLRDTTCDNILFRNINTIFVSITSSIHSCNPLLNGYEFRPLNISWH